MKKYFNVRSSTIIVGLALTALVSVAQAKDLVVYGKVHVSGDIVDNGSTTDYAVGSNSSRIGFKGDKALNNSLTAIWQIESNFDVTGERTTITARNRYLGLKHNYGKMIVGYYDTPFKSMGKYVSLMSNTIAERRGLIGNNGGYGTNGPDKFDRRARNSVMLVSPKMGGVQFKVMRTTGSDSDKDDNDEYKNSDSKPLTSVSALYKAKKFYVGVAYEDQRKIKVNGFRVAGGVKLGAAKVNAIYEKLSADSDSSESKSFDRAAYGASVAYKVGKTTLKAQAFIKESSAYKDDTGAMLYAVGVDQDLGKKFTVYAIFAGMNNDKYSKAPLGGSGHGEKYYNKGKDLKGLSLGMIYSF